MYVSWSQLVDAVLYDSSLYVIYVGYILRSLRMHKLSLDRIRHQCHINLYLHLSFIIYIYISGLRLHPHGRLNFKDIGYSHFKTTCKNLIYIYMPLSVYTQYREIYMKYTQYLIWLPINTSHFHVSARHFKRLCVNSFIRLGHEQLKSHMFDIHQTCLIFYINWGAKSPSSTDQQEVFIICEGSLLIFSCHSTYISKKKTILPQNHQPASSQQSNGMNFSFGRLGHWYQLTSRAKCSILWKPRPLANLVKLKTGCSKAWTVHNSRSIKLVFQTFNYHFLECIGEVSLHSICLNNRKIAFKWWYLIM